MTPSLYRSLQQDLIALEISRTSWWAMPIYLFLSPGFFAIFFYRLAALMFQSGNIIGRIIGRIFWFTNNMHTGCHLDPRAIIGPGCALPHPTGIVIGNSVIVGDHVTIYQNVTLGRRNSPTENIRTSPIIGNHVCIYAGAVIVGGINVGHGASIGANAVVLTDVPPNAVAVGVPAHIVEKHASTAA